MGTDRFHFTSQPKTFTLDVWKNIPGFSLLEVKNGFLVLRYKGGSVRDLLNAIRAEPAAEHFRLSFIVFGKKHRWSFDYTKQTDTLHLYRISCSYGILKKKSQKTSRFYGVCYDPVINGDNWVAFYYMVPLSPHEEARNVRDNGKNRKTIDRFSSEHEAAVTHDAFILWWNMKGRLNYPRFKRPADVEELYLYVTPKEKFMGGLRPDCYACIHHKELPASARISCNADRATVVGHKLGILHGWFNYPTNFDPLWVQTCDKFMPKGGIHEQKRQDSKEEGNSVKEGEKIE